MLTTFSDDPDLLKKGITSDESWVYGYDIETKAQSSQWKVLFASIAMAWCIMNSCYKVVRLIRNKYLEVMRRLRKAIRQKCTELWKNQSWKTKP